MHSIRFLPKPKRRPSPNLTNRIPIGNLSKRNKIRQDQIQIVYNIFSIHLKLSMKLHIMDLVKSSNHVLNTKCYDY